MNKYGDLALRYWRRERAEEYAQIEDPTRFFTQMGEEIEAEIDRRATALEQKEQAGQSVSYLENLGQLNNIRISVEDEVMREMVYLRETAE